MPVGQDQGLVRRSPGGCCNQHRLLLSSEFLNPFACFAGVLFTCVSTSSTVRLRTQIQGSNRVDFYLPRRLAYCLLIWQDMHSSYFLCPGGIKPLARNVCGLLYHIHLHRVGRLRDLSLISYNHLLYSLYLNITHKVLSVSLLPTYQSYLVNLLDTTSHIKYN